MTTGDRRRALVSRVTPPTFLADIAAAVDARIAAVLDAEIARWSELEVELAEPLTALRSFILAGGKRLRPAFCHWAFVGAGGSAGDPAVVDAGAALELLHTFALVHDDIMDGSSIRRGTETIHVAFEDGHGLDGRRGERRRLAARLA